jgi:hypothetical protein
MPAMKKCGLLTLFILLIQVLQPVHEATAWGFFAHKRINEMAVFTLPPSLIGFYKKHITFLREHAVDPDRRRYADPEEGSRHFFDSEYYRTLDVDSIPKGWTEALARYGKDSLKKHGIVPWHIMHTFYRLRNAFREQNIDLILHYSADLGHYVADAHVPLHTTKNYNGQFTNQTGIHAFWESRIPELNASRYDYFTGRATYLPKPIESIWSVIWSSYEAVDSVLMFEAGLNASFPPDRKFSYETHAGQLQKVYSEEYSQAYNRLLDHMVERRMQGAIRMVGNLWYTAWVDGGQPDLERMERVDISDSLRNVHRKMEEEWKRSQPPDSSGHTD